MPTVPSPAKLSASGMEIYNVIRANASSEYQDRIPVGTRDNIKDVYNSMMSYQPAMNEFLSALVNRIGRVILTSKMYENPLRMFKKGMLEFGETVEEIFVNIAKAHQYNPDVAEEQIFKREIPDVRAVFHKMNLQNFYKQTISNDQLRQAFLSWQGISDLIAKIVDAMYTAANYDEYITMRNLFQLTIESGRYYPVQIDAVTDEASAKKFLTTVRSYSNQLTFMSTDFNAMGVATHTPKEDQILIINPQYDALIDVEALAYAFNDNKADFEQRKVMVDKLPDNVAAMIVDRDWFMVFDNYQNFTEQYNGEGLYWNYWYHVWKTFSTSPFANCIVFTTAAPTVTSVTVSPATGTATRGTPSVIQFNANVAGTNSPSQGVIWSISGNGVLSSTITDTGLFRFNPNEASTTITITATSELDKTVSGTATVTVSA